MGSSKKAEFNIGKTPVHVCQEGDELTINAPHSPAGWKVIALLEDALQQSAVITPKRTEYHATCAWKDPNKASEDAAMQIAMHDIGKAVERVTDLVTEEGKNATQIMANRAEVKRVTNAAIKIDLAAQSAPPAASGKAAQYLESKTKTHFEAAVSSLEEMGITLNPAQKAKLQIDIATRSVARVEI